MTGPRNKFVMGTVLGAVIAMAFLAPQAAAGQADRAIVLPGATGTEGVARLNGQTFFAGDLLTGDIFRGTINKGSAAVSVPITVAGGTAAPAAMTPYVTSATDNIAAKTALPVTGGVFTAALDSMTVTTFVGK